MASRSSTTLSNTTSRLNPPRLPPLPKLRVRRPNPVTENPCNGFMTSVLACWATAGGNATGCLHLEQKLRACMDEKRPKNQKKNTINYHLMRLYPKIRPKAKVRK